MEWKYLLILCVLYFVYLFIGGAVFSAIERPSEEAQCKEVQDGVAYLADIIKNMENITVQQLVNFTKLIQAAGDFGIQVDENFNVTCQINWDFSSAFFFSGTVITTIGYGHIAPTTHLGRSICIIYAIIGIPLFALMFAGLGDRIAERVRKLDAKITTRAQRSWVRKVILFLVVTSSFLILCLLIPSAIFMAVEDWSYNDAFYYSFITITTIGFGDFVAGINPDKTYIAVYRIMVYFWILFGMAYMATVISIITDFWKTTGENARLRRTRAGDEADGGEEGEEVEDRVTENPATDNGSVNGDDDKKQEKMTPNSSLNASTESLEQRPFNQHYENTKTIEAADEKSEEEHF